MVSIPPDLLCEPEELCDELKECLMKSHSGNLDLISHPLIHEQYFPAFHAKYNRGLREKRELLAEFLGDEKKYYAYILLYAKPYRLQGFDDLECSLMNQNTFLDSRTRWGLLRNVWDESENIWQCLDQWYDYFENDDIDNIRLGMEPEEKEFFDNLPDTFTIYRGTKKGREPGLSYTLNKEKAEWFADRYGFKDQSPLLIEQVVKKEDCLWYLAGRNEDEIVIHPDISDDQFIEQS